MVDGPAFEPAGPTPHANFPAVALHVNPGRQHQGTLGHGADGQAFGLGAGLQGVVVAALAFEFPGLAQRFVGKQLQGAVVALGAGGHGFEEFFDDAGPAALRAVGAPHVQAQAGGRLAGHALVVAPGAVGTVALAGLAAHPGAQRPLAICRGALLEVVGLGDALAAVRADVAHRLGLARLPLEAVGLVFAAPGQRVINPAVRAVDVKAHHAVGQLACGFGLVNTLEQRGGAADELGVRRPLQPALGQALGVAGLFDAGVELGPFIEDGHRHGDAAVGPRRLAAQQVHHAVAELLELDGVGVFAADLAGGAHGLDLVENRVDFAFDVAVAVVVGGLPQGQVAAQVGHAVGDEGSDHLGVAHALGLDDVQILDPVVAHEVHHADLEHPGQPAALLLAGLASHDEELRRPIGQALARLGLETVQPTAHRGLDGGGRFAADAGVAAHAVNPT